MLQLPSFGNILMYMSLLFCSLLFQESVFPTDLKKYKLLPWGKTLNVNS